jgi:hypothetical protein
MKRNTRVAGIVLGTAGAAALLAGCGPLTSSAATPEPSTVTETEPAAETPAEPAAGDDLKHCSRDIVEVGLDAGDHSDPATWNTTVVLTNVDARDCRIEGVSELAFIGQSGDPYDVGQSTIEEGGGDDDLVVLPAGGHAEMYVNYDSAPENDFPEDQCSPPVGANVTLPGDDQPMEVAMPDALDVLPPLCDGPVQVTPWGPGDPPR